VLVSRWVYDAAAYGGLVAIVSAAWYAIRHRERRVEPKLPPAATGHGGRRYVGRIAPVIVLIVLVGVESALLTHAHDAIVIDPGPSPRRVVFVGSEPPATTPGYGPILVVNHSEHPIKLYRIDYDDYQVLHVIRPGTIALTPTVDFLGADQPPTDPNAEDRTWLTWD
jgi:hypothetical protein